MDLGYQGKVAGITGAASSKGIGFAIARQMLREGASVFLCDLKQEAVDAAVKELSAYGTVRGYAADVSGGQAVAAMFDRAMADFGKIDVFVSNAGIYPQCALMDMTTAQWDTVMGEPAFGIFMRPKRVPLHERPGRRAHQRGLLCRGAGQRRQRRLCGQQIGGIQPDQNAGSGAGAL